jgi:hypothetical protein
MKRRQPGSYVGGVALILFGGWLAATELGVPLVGFDKLWPLIPVLIGVTLLAQNSEQSLGGSGIVLVGLTLLLSGLFLCLFTLKLGNLSWQSLNSYWPIFLFIVGVAFLFVYLRDGTRRQPLLLPAYLIGGAGLLLLPVTLNLLQSTGFRQAIRLWPLFLILVTSVAIVTLRNHSHDVHVNTE